LVVNKDDVVKALPPLPPVPEVTLVVPLPPLPPLPTKNISRSLEPVTTN
jgi:hypothetical protein